MCAGSPFNRKALGAWIVLAAILGAAPAFADDVGQQMAEEAGRSIIGTPAPRLVLTSIDGRKIDLAQLYGRQAVYLKFWATWCIPCRKQMPHFERTYEHAGKDLAVIAVDVAFNDSVDEIRKYRKAVTMKMPIVMDDGRLADALHLRVTPQHVVIGRDGNIAYVGHLADERLESALKAARMQPAVASMGTAADALPAVALGIGSLVPDITLQSIEGNPIRLGNPADTASTVILFMSPWCETYFEKSRPRRAAACKRGREQGDLLAADAHTRIIAIASGLWASTSDLVEYRDEFHVKAPLSLDESGALFRSFGVKEVPTVVVLDTKGRISARFDQLSGDLAQQIRAQAPAVR